MKAILLVVGVTVITLGLVGGAVFGLGDDEMLVAPPEVVAEQFVEALAHGRPRTAHDLLARDAAGSASPTSVADASRRFRSRIGGLERVKATVQDRRRNRVIVRAEIEGTRLHIALLLPLIRESGLWRVEGLGEALITIAQRPAERGIR